MKAPSDVRDDETMRELVTFVGEQIWGEICDWLNQWLALRFEDSVAGALVRLLLEMLKAAHRSRAEGWSACQLTLTLMRRFDSLQPYRKRAFQFLRLAEVFIARQVLDQALWDAPQLLRSVVKRVASSGCLEPRLTRALVSFPKCFFGKLFAALLRLCQLRGCGCYLEPQMRDALVAQFLDDCATGVAGAWLLRLLPASGLRLTVDDGADTQGEPQLSSFDVCSVPAQLTALFTAGPEPEPEPLDPPSAEDTTSGDPAAAAAAEEGEATEVCPSCNRIPITTLADTTPSPRCVSFQVAEMSVSSEPATPSETRCPSLVALLLQLRAGDASKGIQGAASRRENEDSMLRVAELVERSCNDGHWILWGRGMGLEAHHHSSLAHKPSHAPHTTNPGQHTPLHRL